MTIPTQDQPAEQETVEQIRADIELLTRVGDPWFAKSASVLIDRVERAANAAKDREWEARLAAQAHEHELALAATKLARDEVLEAKERAWEEAAEKTLAKEEAPHSNTISQRDEAEEAISQAYFLIVGRSAEWSNNFGYEQALEEIGDAQSVLRQALRVAERLAEERATVLRQKDAKISELRDLNLRLRIQWTEATTVLRDARGLCHAHAELFEYGQTEAEKHEQDLDRDLLARIDAALAPSEPKEIGE